MTDLCHVGIISKGCTWTTRNKRVSHFVFRTVGLRGTETLETTRNKKGKDLHVVSLTIIIVGIIVY